MYAQNQHKQLGD